MSDTLYEKITARAKKDTANHVELTVMAKQLSDAMGSKAGVPELLSVWARVRKRWCEISGEPLVSATVAKTAARILKRRTA